MRLPASSLRLFILLEVTANAGLGLNGKIRDSSVPSDAHLTSHCVGTWTTITAYVAMDWGHSGAAKTTLC